MVAEEERGYKAVNYSQLPLVLLQAIRELKAENETLRSEMESQRREFQGGGEHGQDRLAHEVAARSRGRPWNVVGRADSLATQVAAELAFRQLRSTD
jgi:hypothetical protein